MVILHWCAQVLDSALLRPGRFDRRVSVERPDRMGREQILRVHIERRQLPLSDDVSVGMVASSTVGFTGADLANLVNEAALLAGRDSKGGLPPRSQHLSALCRRWGGSHLLQSGQPVMRKLQARSQQLLPALLNKSLYGVEIYHQVASCTFSAWQVKPSVAPMSPRMMGLVTNV